MAKRGTKGVSCTAVSVAILDGQQANSSQGAAAAAATADSCGSAELASNWSPQRTRCCALGQLAEINISHAGMADDSSNISARAA